MGTNPTANNQCNSCTSDYNSLKLLDNIAAVNIEKHTFDENLLHISSMISENLSADVCSIILKNAEGRLANIFGDNVEIGSGTPSIIEVAQTGKPIIYSEDDGKYICTAIKTGRAVLGVVYAEGSDNCFGTTVTAQAMELCGIFIGLKISNLILKQSSDKNERLATAGRAILDLSHSVKNILQMVNGAADVIDLGLQTKQMDRVKRNWAILKPNLDRLRKFMLDMLDYSKDRPLCMSECDFNKLIQDAIESLQSQLKQKLSQLAIQIDQKMPIVILDGERILEMALNIILNAIDIVDEEDGIVCVETQYSKEQQTVTLRVTDNGPGMDEQMKEKLFVPFESGKNKFGTGLGMAIAKRIIDAHKGSIEVDSQLNVGTTITITLPVKIAEK